MPHDAEAAWNRAPLASCGGKKWRKMVGSVPDRGHPNPIYDRSGRVTCDTEVLPLWTIC